MRAHENSSPCPGCRDGAALDFDFAMAFQPIVDAETGVFAYEALVRGPQGESAADVLEQVTHARPSRFLRFGTRTRRRSAPAASAAAAPPRRRGR